MGMHDTMAHMAVAAGHTPAKFYTAAQNHANMTWIFVIAAGVVLYFAGWAWALIPAAVGVFSALRSVSATMVAVRLEKKAPSASRTHSSDFAVIQGYGEALETAAPYPGTVADARKLPYSKQKIKDALIAALQAEEDQQIRASLVIGYISLADWQEGVGDIDQGFDTRPLSGTQDAWAIVSQVAGIEPKGMAWIDVAQREREVLKQELEALGLW